MSTENDERRRHLRINHSQIVSYTHYNDVDEVDKTGGVGTTADISLSGVLIRIADEFEINTKIDLDISLGELMIRTSGRIMRVLTVEGGLYDVGIQFEDIDEGDLERLKEFFTERNIPF